MKNPVRIKLKIAYLFEEYPLFYQPYIPPIITELGKNSLFKITIYSFKKSKSTSVKLLPSYYKRRIVERLFSIFSKYRNLNYFEILALRNKVDVIHIQHSYLFPKILNLLSRPKDERPKIIITLRGGDTYVKPWVDDKWKKFYANEGRFVDAFIVMSNHQKSYLMNWGIESDNIFVIPISFGPLNKIPPRELFQNEVRICSVFRMCWEKNLDANIRVIKILKESGVPVKYDVYGDGPDLGQVFYLVNKYNIQSEVIIHGRVRSKDLQKRLIDSDFILQLSHSDALPASILEAQSFGIPAIVAESGGLPESIVHDRTGYVVKECNPKEAAKRILKLWNDKELYKTFSVAAIDFSSQNFSNEKEVSELTQLYMTI